MSYSPDQTPALMGAFVAHGLSASVARILAMRALGNDNATIADTLGVSRQHIATTVYKHKTDLHGIIRLCTDCMTDCPDRHIPKVMATICTNYMEEQQ